MKKRSEKQNKKIRNLVLFCSLCAILLSVSTYAWFIGMKTVNVAEFDVKIATTEGLFLSMDGADWKYELDAKNTAAYAGNANTWADGEGEGLIPMSSVGDMDEESSRMKLYEKGSLKEIFKELIGDAKTKPFECVGTTKEVRFSISYLINKLNKENQKLPLLLKFYNENYELSDITEPLLKEFNEQNNLPIEFVNLLKEELKRCIEKL